MWRPLCVVTIWMSKCTAWVTEQERGEDIWGQPCQGKGILNNEDIGLRLEEEFEREPGELN